MKRQAWGWLMAGMLAAGLNAGYHDGGFQWAHEMVSRVEHNSAAILALATGRADQFLAEAQLISARHEARSRPFVTGLTRMGNNFGPAEERVEHLKAVSDEMMARRQIVLARLESNRARIEGKIAAHAARFRCEPAVFDPVGFKDIKIQTACPRVRMTIPKIHIRAPMINVKESDSDPI